MNECIIPVSWEHLDSMIHFLETQMTRQNVPTVLRLRTQLVLEEVFEAALSAPGADTAKIRCTFPAPRTVLFQCRSARADFAPDWSALQSLEGAECTYGLRYTLSGSDCQVLVGQK